MVSFVEFVLLISAVVAFYICLEARSRIYSIFSLLVGTIFIGLYYLAISVTLVGLFHLLVYSGFITTVFLSVSFTSEKENVKERVEYE